MEFYKFTLRVRHDEGYITFRIVSQSEESAIHSVMLAEMCPRIAVRRIWKGKRVY